MLLVLTIKKVDIWYAIEKVIATKNCQLLISTLFYILYIMQVPFQLFWTSCQVCTEAQYVRGCMIMVCKNYPPSNSSAGCIRLYSLNVVYSAHWYESKVILQCSHESNKFHLNRNWKVKFGWISQFIVAVCTPRPNQNHNSFVAFKLAPDFWPVSVKLNRIVFAFRNKTSSGPFTE